MSRWIFTLVAFTFLLNACKEEAAEPAADCENCLTFTDPQGVKRTFTVYSKEVDVNTNYRDSSGNQYPNTLLKLYFSESPSSIFGLWLYTNRPYDFKQNYTLSGINDTRPDSPHQGTYNRALVTFWDGGNTSNFAYLALKSNVQVEEYSYSEKLNDQHILKGKMDLVFERSDTTKLIPSFGVNRAEIKDAMINIEF